jgi:hypothetical protein
VLNTIMSGYVLCGGVGVLYVYMYILSRVYGSVTNNNRFWTEDLLTASFTYHS